MQRSHRLTRSKAIAVGLDRCPGRHPRTVLKPAPIVLERGSIEPQSKRAVHCRRLALLLLRVEFGFRCRPVPAVEYLDGQFQGLVEAIGIQAPAVGMRSRLVEALHAAMAAEEMLG